MGVIVLVSSQKDNKRDNFDFKWSFCSKRLGRIPRPTPFKAGSVITIVIKTTWTTKRAFVTSLQAIGEHHRRLSCRNVIRSRWCTLQNKGITWRHFFRSPPRALILNRISDTTLPGGNPPPPQSVRHQHLHQITGKQNLPAWKVESPVKRIKSQTKTIEVAMTWQVPDLHFLISCSALMLSFTRSRKIKGRSWHAI